MSRGMCFIIVELGKFKRSMNELKDRREDWSFLFKHSGNLEREKYEQLQKRNYG